jgi:hypothetical protein
MFETNNKIIIVDDKKEDLQTLAEVFLNTGVGCKTILYDSLYNEQLKGVRIAFFDINITNKAIDINQKEFNYKTDPSLSSAFNDLAVAIEGCIHKDNGPFALIFWSSNTNLIDNFKEFVRDVEKGFSNMTSPILIDCIDKNQFTGKPEELLEKLKSLFSGKSIELLLDFEHKSSISSSQLINDFFSLIPKNPNPEDQIWGNYKDFEGNFEKVFSKIAVSTLGYKYGKENPDKAILEALLPIQNHLILNQSLVSSPWKTFLTSLKGSPKYPSHFDEGKLNTIFHIENAVSEKDARGAVIEIDKTNNAILKSFGIIDVDQWIKKIIPFKSGIEALEQETITSTQLIAVELSAACDFSNKKPRINKYMLGILTPKINVEDDINHKIRPESSYHLGGCSFSQNGNNFQIWLNLNFVLGCSSDDDRLGDLKFILKKEIMDMIGNKYAGHVSRIGITSF